MSTAVPLDFQDDFDGRVLKQRFPSAECLPECVKTANIRSAEQMALLPDDAFALVVTDGERRLRKFACVDQGNTALSVIYLLENAPKMSKEAQAVTAHNLVDACYAFDLTPPSMLLKMAECVKVVNKAIKKADLTGSDVMPLQNVRAGETNKVAERYVDITKVAHVSKDRAVAKLYCLEKTGSALFPLDSYGDVLEANRWFEERGNCLSPDDRREYCVKLAKRADTLGIRITDKIQKYASTTARNPEDFEASVAMRKQFWTTGSTEHGVLDGLTQKYASVSPDVMCAALGEFDRATGLSHMWDAGVPDPYLSVYTLEKRAEWSWEQDVDCLKEDQLKQGVLDPFKIDQIRKRFGEDIAKGMIEKPIEVFGSLPVDVKRIMSKILKNI